MMSLLTVGLVIAVTGFALCAVCWIAIVILGLTGHGTLVREIKRPHIVVDRHGRIVQSGD